MYYLKLIENKLSLTQDGASFKPFAIDFLAGTSRHRRDYGGGRGQLIAKAVGLKKLDAPSILDLTAGMGQDAYVLACLGCRVTMLERSPLIAALLDDALKRLFADPTSHDLALHLVQDDALLYLKKLEYQPDVIYLDPMYPDSKNSALPKKEMRMLREIVGDDMDASHVCEVALHKAKHRVVVKRPRLGERLLAREPDVVFIGKSSRFDVYVRNSQSGIPIP